MVTRPNHYGISQSYTQPAVESVTTEQASTVVEFVGGHRRTSVGDSCKYFKQPQ